MRAGLTRKQEGFCSFYVQTGNGVESARRAGYAGNNGVLRAVASENLTKPNIKARIDEKQAARNKRMQLKEDYELEKAVRILEKCMADEEIKDTDGKLLRFDASNANRAVLTVAQLRGKLTTKAEITSVAAGSHEGLEARRAAARAAAAAEAEDDE